LLRGSERKHAEDVEDSGSEPGAGGSQWKSWKLLGTVEDMWEREGVRRGAGGPEEVQKAREVIVRYKFPHTMSSLCEFFCI